LNSTHSRNSASVTWMSVSITKEIEAFMVFGFTGISY
jgi:hypothetical protein